LGKLDFVVGNLGRGRSFLTLFGHSFSAQVRDPSAASFNLLGWVKEGLEHTHARTATSKYCTLCWYGIVLKEKINAANELFIHQGGGKEGDGSRCTSQTSLDRQKASNIHIDTGNLDSVVGQRSNQQHAYLILEELQWSTRCVLLRFVVSDESSIVVYSGQLHPWC
jgi:hypothetical protein